MLPNLNFMGLKRLLSITRISIALFCLCTSMMVNGQNTENTKTKDRPEYFVAYEFGEMAFNGFQNFAGEIGTRFSNGHMLRLAHMNVKLSEKHLSSDFANVVDGPNVEGLFKGLELFYDIPVYKNLHLGGSIGYYNDFYQHTFTNEKIDHKTGTVGFELNYRETDLFKLKGLYFNLAFPFRFYFDPLEETSLSNSTVNRHFFENNIWFFVGYQF